MIIIDKIVNKISAWIGSVPGKKYPVYIPVLQSELLRGRVAVITGGTKGIGFGIAKAFMTAGANVAITGHNEEHLNVAVAKLKNTAPLNLDVRVTGHIIDNSDVLSFPTLLQRMVDQIGMFDILVNNAGLVGGNGIGFTSLESYDSIMDTNLRGAYFLSQQVANLWRENKVKGNILNICSTSSLRPGTSPYIISKWGVRALTVGLAKVLIKDGIVVNGIGPGPTATVAFTNGSDSISWAKNPSGRLVTIEEIGNMATILVSDLGKSIVGDIVYMGGGAGTVTFDDV